MHQEIKPGPRAGSGESNHHDQRLHNRGLWATPRQYSRTFAAGEMRQVLPQIQELGPSGEPPCRASYRRSVVLVPSPVRRRIYVGGRAAEAPGATPLSVCLPFPLPLTAVTQCIVASLPGNPGRAVFRPVVHVGPGSSECAQPPILHERPNILLLVGLGARHRRM